MDKNVMLAEIENLIDEGNKKVLASKWQDEYKIYTFVKEDVYYSWRTKCLTFLKLFIGEDSDYIVPFYELKKNLYKNAATCVQTLENIKEYWEKGFVDFEHRNEIDVNEALDRIFNRFHKVARQLRSRHADRSTLEIEDEYDVQDLLHSLLQLYFDDIRAEEWTPSYAGSAARVDFLLKKEKTVIEVKKTRQGLADKEIGNQLIEDIERYKIHPDCERLICFVYDPEGRVGNPNGLMTDLNNRHEGFSKVIIQPNI